MGSEEELYGSNLWGVNPRLTAKCLTTTSPLVKKTKTFKQMRETPTTGKQRKISGLYIMKVTGIAWGKEMTKEWCPRAKSTTRKKKKDVTRWGGDKMCCPDVGGGKSENLHRGKTRAGGRQGAGIPDSIQKKNGG